jgi:hypothetical protein
VAATTNALRAIRSPKRTRTRSHCRSNQRQRWRSWFPNRNSKVSDTACPPAATTAMTKGFQCRVDANSATAASGLASQKIVPTTATPNNVVADIIAGGSTTLDDSNTHGGRHTRPSPCRPRRAGDQLMFSVTVYVISCEASAASDV